MRQTSIKSNRVAELLEEVTARTGESKVEAVTRSLEERLGRLEPHTKSRLTLDWLRTSVWPDLGEYQGLVPSEEEQEELLGFS